jgi:hypothetical protein
VGGEVLLKLKASLASAEVSAGAVAKADQHAQYYILAINCNFTTLFTILKISKPILRTN